MPDPGADVRKRAYEIWEQQGRPPGFKEAHWHQAQIEVQTRRAAEVRTAGRKEMRDPPADWDIVDEQSDQSFPAVIRPEITSSDIP